MIRRCAAEEIRYSALDKTFPPTDIMASAAQGPSDGPRVWGGAGS
jgi:hypothetical protein